MCEARDTAKTTTKALIGERLIRDDLTCCPIERQRRSVLRLSAVTLVDRKDNRCSIRFGHTDINRAPALDLLLGLRPQAVQPIERRCASLFARAASWWSSFATALHGRLLASRSIDQRVRPRKRHRQCREDDNEQRDR